MITGNKVLEVIGYLPIDHNAERLMWVLPKTGEMFIGHPYGFHAINSTPFIEIVNENNKTIKTINCSDIAEIEFAIKKG